MFSFNGARISLICLLAAYLILGSSVCAACGQAAKQVKPPPPRHLQSQLIGKEPNLPYLPKYSGKYLRFRGGIYSSGLTAGKGFSYHLRYETAESPNDVLNWYQGALKSYGYNIAEFKPAKLMAFNPERGATVLVIVMGPNQPGYSPAYKCHFTVRYIEQEPRKEEKQDDAESK